jgi:ornithine carbamoyltransferase
MPEERYPKHLLRVSDFGPASLLATLNLAQDMKRFPHDFVGTFSGDAVACYFEKPSTRTRVSFEVACARLGLLPIMLRPEELQLGRGETIGDTAAVLSRYTRAMVMRVFSHKMLEDLASTSSIPVINALSDEHHPCQALADLLTIREHFGALQGVKLIYLGDANNVAQSLMEAGALSGMHVIIAAPQGYRPDLELESSAIELAVRSGGSITVVEDPHELIGGANVVYSDVFVSMGDDAQAQERREVLAPYQVTTGLMRAADPGAIFMHCLPAHRGQEVEADVIDGPQSVVFDQAANRMPTEQALLYALIQEGNFLAAATTPDNIKPYGQGVLDA